VPRDAKEADIHRAYKNAARLHHPDKNPSNREEAEVSFKRIAEAYAVLRDPARRREYDASGGSSRSYVSYEEAEQLWRSFGRGGEAQEAAAEAAQALLHNEEGRRKILAVVAMLATLIFAPRVIMTMLPGLTAALIFVALLSRRESNGKLAWLAMALLLVSFAAPWMMRLRAGMGTRSAEIPGGGSLVGREQPLGSPHSGELVFVDGSFTLLADPLIREQGGDLASGPIEEGWQKRLLASMTTAIKGGEEQVLMIFSRQGCPWCVRQEPVLRRAIQRRAGVGDADEEAPDEEAYAAAAFVPLGRAAIMGDGPVPARSGGLLFAPLRVFIFDTGEFPGLAQSFGIEALPTTVAWGPPGVVPSAAKGYLDEENFDTLLRAMATAEPQGAGGEKKKRRGLFR